jgi:hypothetical protein
MEPHVDIWHLWPEPHSHHCKWRAEEKQGRLAENLKEQHFIFVLDLEVPLRKVLTVS